MTKRFDLRMEWTSPRFSADDRLDALVYSMRFWATPVVTIGRVPLCLIDGI